MSVDEQKILGVLEDEIELFFMKIGKKNDLINNNITCNCCSVIINKNNFGGVLKLNDQYNFYCDKKQCLEKMYNQSGEK